MREILNILLCIMILFNFCACDNSQCKNGHTWTNATCKAPKTCSVCKATEGNKLEHSWDDATCTTPKTCSKCQTTTGLALGHNVDTYNIALEATCTSYGKEEGNCTICNEILQKRIEKQPHTDGEWKVTKEATENSSGLKTLYCATCNTSIKTEEYTLSPEEIRANYINKCSSYSYDEIARNPENYKGKYATFKGEVIQVMEDGNNYTLRVNITQGRYTWEDTILVSYTKKSASESRILDDDIITLYGTLAGTYTYESVLGAEITVPLLYAEYITVN